MIPTEPNAELPGRETAIAQTEAGFPIAEATLTWKASHGGGPLFRKWNRKAQYNLGDSLEWAKARTSRPIRRVRELREGADHEAP